MSFNLPPAIKSEDFVRIKNLPVRTGAFYPTDLRAEMTRLLKVPGGEQTLFDVQARALYDLGMSGEMAHGKRPRGFFPIKVAGGKSLISLLAPRMVPCKRPLLALPAGMVEPTMDKMRTLAKHWNVAKHMPVWSYQMLGRVAGADKLEIYRPDLIIVDEGHWLKNPRAAVTRRFARYMHAHPETIFVTLTGTPMKDSIKNFAHLLAWSHGEHSPVPLHAEAIREWAEALDEGLNPMARRSPGILLDLYPYNAPDASEDPIILARQKFRCRLNDTLGVVVADGKDEYGGSLSVSALEYKPNKATDDNFQRLREEMVRPDGWALTEAMQVWAVARMLALGLHYEWDPVGPEEWLLARKVWAAFVRDILKSPRSIAEGWDSELQIANAVGLGHLDDDHALLEDWRRIKPTFTPNPVPVWHDPTALKVCADWLADHDKGICWVEHRHFGKALSAMTGIPYYGAKGLDPKGVFIQAHPKGPVIASIAANSTGRDLQHKWCDNLVTAPPCDSDRWEQLMARTHRFGQPADSVTVDVLMACREHLESIPRALSASDVKKDVLGLNNKIRIADLSWPDTHTPRSGPRWL